MCVCVCVREGERERACVCVRVCEREGGRERERVGGKERELTVRTTMKTDDKTWAFTLVCKTKFLLSAMCQ